MVTKKTHTGADRIFRALADPTRRVILILLRARRRSVSDIARNFQISRPAISKHLRILHAAGLVSARPKGTSRLFELNAHQLRPVGDWLATANPTYRRKNAKKSRQARLR